ncbi:MAG: DNA polymerase Y family protein, partial [Verrucomicrobiales bacterium]|nr:DNA polymerase Y family protein [Verrucomicrobiales bacterium]
MTSPVHDTPGFAVIRCADFRLQSVVRRVQTLSDPIALVDDSKRQSVILSRNEAAIRFGVESGMKTVQALARCPGLRVESPSAPAETLASRLLLETAFSWVPGIEETEPGCLTLDLSTQSPEKWEGCACRTRGRLYEKGLEVTIGLGETPSLARIAALAAGAVGKSVWHLKPSHRQAQLERLPLVIGEVEEGLRERLALWGMETLGAFAKLQREDVASRLGDEGVALWLRLNGKTGSTLRYARLDELFEEHLAFDYEISDREPLLFVVNRFLDRLIERVGATGRGVAAVHLLLHFSDGSCHAKRLSLPEPVLEHEILFHLISGHIDGLDMKAPVTELRLRVEPSDVVATQRNLFGTGLKSRFRYEETMKRLRRIVGSERVGSPRPCDTHRPGVFELVPLPAELEEFVAEKGAVASVCGAPVTGAPAAGAPTVGAPIRRFRAGTRAGVVMRDGRPVRLEAATVTGEVIASVGPWYAVGDWWDSGKSWSRVEWDIEVKGQGVFRVVREG